MSSNKRMGRPPVAPEERRDLVVRVYLNEAERKALDAARGDKPAGRYLRECGLPVLP